MSSIDERVVEMQFNNGQFQDGIRDTIGALDQLKTSLNFQGVESSLEDISSKISVVGAIAFTAIQNLTNSALGLGGQLLNSILDPLLQGGERRALAIEQARFQFRGLGLDVEATMASAREAVLGTAFGLDAAASAAAQFAASGMRAGPEMTSALRAISGVAAQTGSSYEDISRIFIGVSGNARLMGNDLLSLSTRGINAAATLAQSMGISEAEVRQLVTKGQISFQEFYQAMDTAFGENATKASETFTGSLSNMRAALSRVGAAFATVNFENQRNLFNALTPVIDKIGAALVPVIALYQELSGIGNASLVSFISGLDLEFVAPMMLDIVAALRHIYGLAMQVKDALAGAFSDIFPSDGTSIGDKIRDIVWNIWAFIDTIRLGDAEVAKIRTGFAGFFAVLDIGRMFVMELLGLLGRLFGEIMPEGEGTFLDTVESIGEFLIGLRDTIKETGAFETAFNVIGDILVKIIDIFKRAKDAVLDIRDGIADFLGTIGGAAGDVAGDPGGVGGWVDNLRERIQGLANLGDIISLVWDGIVAGAMTAWNVIAPVMFAIGGFFADMGADIADALQRTDFNAILDTLNLGLLTSIVVMLRNFLNPPLDDGNGGLMGQVQEVLGGLQESLSAFTASIKVGTLLLIAAAVGILAASAVALATVDSEALLVSLSAMTIMFGQLLGFMAVFDAISGSTGFLKMGMVAASFIILGIALRILVSSVIALSALSWEELGKGLSAVTALMAVMIGVSRTMGGSIVGLQGTAVAMILLAVAIKILASALGDFVQYNWEELGRGMAAIAVGMGILVAASQLMKGSFVGLTQTALAMILMGVALKIFASALGDFTQFSWEELARGMAAIAVGMGILIATSQLMKGSFVGLTQTAIAMILLGVALKILASAVGDFAAMSWDELTQGFIGLVGTLLGVAVAMQAMPDNLPILAIGLLAISVALNIMAAAMATLGGMSPEQMLIAIVGLAATLALLVIAVNALSATATGIVAIVAISGALMLMAMAMSMLGSMSIEQILTGLAALAGVLLLLGIAGYVLTPTIPTLLGLGAAMLLLGVGVALAGVGVGLLAIGLTALGVALAAVTVGVVTFIAGIIGLIPMLFEQIGYGIVALAVVLGQNMPLLVEAIVTLALGLIEALGIIVPELIILLGEIVIALLDMLATLLPQVIELLVSLILQLIAALTEIIPDIVNLAVQIVLALLEGIQTTFPVLIDTVLVLIMTLVNAIVTLVPFLVDAGYRLITGVINGIANNIGGIINAGTNLIVNFLDGIGAAIPRLIQAAADLIVDFLNGIASGINNNAARIRQAGLDIAMAIIDGLTGGLASGVSSVINAAADMAGSALNAAMEVLGIASPSKEFFQIGEFADMGLANGMLALAGLVAGAARNVGNTAITSLQDTLSNMNDVVPDSLDMSPTIRPVLDLSAVQSEASRIDGLLAASALTASADLDNATAIVESQEDIRAQREYETGPTVVNNNQTFNQTNNSPKALPVGEIYRDTRNLLSITRNKLGDD